MHQTVLLTFGLQACKSHREKSSKQDISEAVARTRASSGHHLLVLTCEGPEGAFNAVLQEGNVFMRDVKTLKSTLRDKGLHMRRQLKGLQGWVGPGAIEKQGSTGFIIGSLYVDEESCP